MKSLWKEVMDSFLIGFSAWILVMFVVIAILMVIELVLAFIKGW